MDLIFFFFFLFIIKYKVSNNKNKIENINNIYYYYYRFMEDCISNNIYIINSSFSITIKILIYFYCLL